MFLAWESNSFRHHDLVRAEKLTFAEDFNRENPLGDWQWRQGDR
jgi:hypothetical protein